MIQEGKMGRDQIPTADAEREQGEQGSRLEEFRAQLGKLEGMSKSNPAAEELARRYREALEDFSAVEERAAQFIEREETRDVAIRDNERIDKIEEQLPELKRESEKAHEELQRRGAEIDSRIEELTGISLKSLGAGRELENWRWERIPEFGGLHEDPAERSEEEKRVRDVDRLWDEFLELTRNASNARTEVGIALSALRRLRGE